MYVRVNMYLQVSLSGVCYTSLVPTNVTLYYWYTGVYNFFSSYNIIVNSVRVPNTVLYDVM